jgi:hypothetical protein
MKKYKRTNKTRTHILLHTSLSIITVNTLFFNETMMLVLFLYERNGFLDVDKSERAEIIFNIFVVYG